MTPVNLFLLRFISVSFGNVASSGGIEPVSLLYDNSRYFKFLSWLRDEGIGPDKSFQLSMRYVRWVSLEMDDGICPVRLVSLWKSSIVSVGKERGLGERAR
ncbi:hypothetical protein HanOQP8_Chr10g0359781 [Helianthus annuus]|nr:hypothetical protein HanOQP8_Chr10g0359781 [Helianthus annuus]